MPRHRRDDQQFRTPGHAFAHEPLELTEGFLEDDFLVDCDAAAVDDRVTQAKGRLAARRGSMREHLERGGEHRATAEISEGIGGVVQPTGAEIGECACAGQHRALQFITFVQHQISNSPRRICPMRTIPTAIEQRH